MISITLHNFKDKESLTVYELPEGSSVIDLKTEIEATEGIPIGHQRLHYGRWDKRDLQNDKSLELLISRGPPKSIFYLVEARIYCQPSFKGDIIESNRTLYLRKEEFFVDLDEPIRTSSVVTHWMYQWSPSELSVLDSVAQRTVNISDISQSFSFYGICNGDVINIVSEPWTTVQWEYYESQRYQAAHRPAPAPPKYHEKYTIVKAKYDWDGEILKHPEIRGLPLERGALFNAVTVIPDSPSFKEIITSPGWLYGTSISSSELNSQLSFFNNLSAGLRKTPQGWFPENFVSPIEKVADQPSEAENVLEIPSLPLFHFPPATGMTFRVPISDKGHSFLKLTVNYECISSPVDPTHVTVSLLCSTHDIRRISAVSVFIMVPEGEASNIQVCENEAHRKEIHTEKEITETQSKEKHFDGFNLGTAGATVELQGGISGKRSFGSTEKGSKVSRRKVSATIDKADTIFWNLKAPASKLDEDGLDGEESITFVLKRKPVLFKYKCRVTHAKNGVEKSIEFDNFKDEESVALYNLPEGSSVLDLKAEIEAIEGIPIGHQRLICGDKDLQDDDDLTFDPPVIRGRRSEILVHLRQAHVHIHLHLLLKRKGTIEQYDELITTIRPEVDLDEPIRTSLPWDDMLDEEVIEPSSVTIFSLVALRPRRNRILDINQSLSYYGICHDDEISIVHETTRLSNRRPAKHRDTPVNVNFIQINRPRDIVVQAKYNWDGRIMHPRIDGLPLERNTLFKVMKRNSDPIRPGWLYGSPVSSSGRSTSSRRMPSFSGKEKGYFPKTFVSAIGENADSEEEEEDLETEDEILDIPPIPPFLFPPADRMTFHMPIGDKGHSFLKITANYELLSSPVDPTHVTMTLWCSTHDVRRVSSISLFIKTPQTTILGVQVCDNEAHREEIHVDKEVTESRSKQRHFDGLNIGTHGSTVGFQGGASRGYSIGSTEKGSRVSRRRVDVGVYNSNTVFWGLKAPTTRLDEDGLIGKESITFILTKKPVQFNVDPETISADNVLMQLQVLSALKVYLGGDSLS
ncbi:hypothetical protein Clacol_004641 [Clathrus columnatus]|uniref:Ubiquitin-like domain-containing protein n=1 Tax=Clathrus columnatus TaxID=1419009 RepID=A0AAV5ABW9_9AGAM|nr:hypothetical protein Clacol_004641 [Clathrus columnatus]